MNDKTIAATVADIPAPYPLHRLGWKAFQDLCVAVAEECLKRPVQTFLPTNDAGRDGAFVGSWDGDEPFSGSSTIQCKFTSKEGVNLSLSMLSEELDKAKALAANGLADDYVLMTNHTVSGASEVAIKKAFESAGVGTCRVFHGNWVSDQIRSSPRLRMLVPRLYGLGDLSDLLDARAYAQTQLILSEMGDSLQKLVVTGAHRKSVKAVSDHNLVLLLGSPAAGKSTIGASLAIGAADNWQCSTIKSTSPDHLQLHINPSEPQFFWIDDAWGTTQFQTNRIEAWNQVFPLMHGAMKKGTKFLITSRDYIWNEAKKHLKLHALPILNKSQVVINVHELTVEEKARILYNHVKFGDQNEEFIEAVKPFLPDLARRHDFLPESARRLGNKFFTGGLTLSKNGVTAFFKEPKMFLQETIETLAPPAKAAIALVFLNGGKIRSPVPTEELESAVSAFGVPAATLRDHLESLNGSILLLAEDEEGPYWTYKHPTVSDAFANYVANSPELIEVYLRGARPNSIMEEVVCAGISIYGAPVVVPNRLHDLLMDRIGSMSRRALGNFISYRSNRVFSERLLELRPDIWKNIDFFVHPLRDDPDTTLLTTLYEQDLLPEQRRLAFVDQVRRSVTEDADSSFLDDPGIANLLTDDEQDELLALAETEVIGRLDEHIDHVRDSWDSEYDPEDHFQYFRDAITTFSRHLSNKIDSNKVERVASAGIAAAIERMMEAYEPSSSTISEAPIGAHKLDSLEELFRDVDE